MKEIHEQPDSVRGTLRGRLDRRFATARLDGLNLTPRELLRFRRIKILGCGSACISGFLGARMIERLSRIPCDAESAAEFRYRNPVIEDDTLYVAVSQSGETFDTLAAVDEIKRKGGAVVGIINVVGSTIARACGRGVYLHAGPEVAVVSTKTFMSTLVAFVLLALHLGRMKDVSAGAGRRLIDALDQLPDAPRSADCRSGAARRACEEVRAFFQRLLRRPQRRLCACDGRRFETEGSQLPARRSVSGIGAETRPARVDFARNAHRGR